MSGVLDAHEFMLGGESLVTSRSKAERKAVDEARMEFSKLIDQAAEQLVQSQRSFEQSQDEKQAQFDQYQNQSKDLFEGWFNSATKSYGEFSNKTEEGIKTLEALYREKLRLEMPAKYWNERASKLRWQSRFWIGLLIVLVAISVGVVVSLLKSISADEMLHIFEDSGRAIKWSVLLVTMLSLLAFGVRVISKLAFSAFHLMRDAEEREQLVYVYLALTKENKEGTDAESRKLILQSLFSRADTGLLKDDASPTMPGNVSSKIFGQQ